MINEDENRDLKGKIMNIKVIIEKGEDDYFVASVPSLKGCWSQGKTREEALKNIREAIDLYLEVNWKPKDYVLSPTATNNIA